MRIAGVDQQHLALTLGRFVVRQHPDIGGDAGVVEHVGGQAWGIEQVVFEDIAADLALAAARSTGKSGEPLRMMPIRAPSGFILAIRCCRNNSEPSETRGRPAPKRPLWPFSRCSSRTCFSTFFQSTPNGGLERQ